MQNVSFDVGESAIVLLQKMHAICEEYYRCAAAGDCKTLMEDVGHALKFGKTLNTDYMRSARSVGLVNKIYSTMGVSFLPYVSV